MAVSVASIARYTNMSKAVRWRVPFVSISGTQYRVDIYDEQDGSWSGITELLAGDTPFTTDEDASDDFFCPVRTQTGKLEICTLKPDGTYITLDDLLPANNIARPIKLWRILGGGAAGVLEWQGFLNCEAYSQDYTSIPQNLSLPIISVLEAMRSIELSSYWFGQVSGETIGDFISDILYQLNQDTEVQVSTIYSQASNDILTKYIFASQYFKYDTNESTGNVTYVYSATSLHDILEDICRFMGWCLREVGSTFYFIRIGSDELGMTTDNMSALQWMGTGHQRTLLQGAKSVGVDAAVNEFKTYFEMPLCPTSGLVQKNRYSAFNWIYDKCTQATVGMFSTTNTAKAFLARFYGIQNDSVYPWDVLYYDVGFNNCIYLTGEKYEDTSYVKLCTVRSVLEFSVICGVANTLEDVGHLVLKIKDETAAKNEVSGYIRCGIKFLGRYYYGVTGNMWTTNPNTTFKVGMEKGNGEIRIEIPRIGNVYTFAKSDIELYLYDDFDNGMTSAVISDISIEYEPPFRKNKDEAKSNRYVQVLSGYRDEINVNLNLASSFNNRNALSHIYGVSEYVYFQEVLEYFEPITSIDYNLAGGTTASRRPEVDLLNRLAAYYGATRQRLELEVAHPTAAPLPLLKLNGINDGKVYLPLSESRDWQTDVCKLTCFEMPQ